MVRFVPLAMCPGHFIPVKQSFPQSVWPGSQWHENCLEMYCILKIAALNQINLQTAPEHFPVTVIMESRPSNSVWQDVSWDAVGICSASEDSQAKDEQRVIKRGEIEQHIYSNLKLRLFLDECESYYHNLMSPKPACFIIAREDDKGCPVPFLVSMSFDEAHAYQEGDDLVYSVPIPAELYRWLEAYVIEHYAPVKRIKRKRKDWKAGE